MNIFKYNIMSGAGFSGGSFGGDWIMCWAGIFIFAVLILLSKKWLEEEEMLGQPFSFIGGMLSIPMYLLLVALFGEAKWAMLSGLVGFFAGGIILARFQNG